MKVLLTYSTDSTGMAKDKTIELPSGVQLASHSRNFSLFDVLYDVVKALTNEELCYIINIKTVA